MKSRKERKRSVLVCAYACEPGSTSEQEIGWKWSTLLAEFNNVCVLTRCSNRETIEGYLEEHGLEPRFKIIYYDLPEWARKWKKGERGLYLYYTLWQFGAFLKARRVHEVERFDIVHYITFGSLLLPNFMWLMPTKYVLGPVGGGENVPLRFLGGFTTKGIATEIIRHTLQALQKVNPFFFLQCFNSDRILVRTNESYEMIPSIFRHKAQVMLETGVPEELIRAERNVPIEGDVIQIITIGRFIHSKINLLTLRVILHFKEMYGIPFRFLIVGDGYERRVLEEFCETKGLSENVTFTGWVPREKVLDYISESDIFYSTTFKEGGTWAFFEAVTMGLPVACLKISGPDLIVADNCGIKISPTSPDQVIHELAEGIYKLATSFELRDEYSINAKQALLNNMTWDKMMARVEKIYREVEGEGTELSD
ncbi:MAG: hypothetical protein DRR42_06400 [Gammaproteobacteria bacterium]|nr:MAG: hypothetical protein DRR42_06400 [Gammaproteobacteria bacterium]